MAKILQELSKGLGFEDQEVTLLLTDDVEIHKLNLEFRNKDKATDVLSFPCEDEDYLGDLVISFEKAAMQAKEYGCSLGEELLRLIIHGYLHLCGFDHVGVSRSEANSMRKMEKKLMGEIKEKWPTWF